MTDGARDEGSAGAPSSRSRARLVSRFMWTHHQLIGRLRIGPGGRIDVAGVQQLVANPWQGTIFGSAAEPRNCNDPPLSGGPKRRTLAPDVEGTGGGHQRAFAARASAAATAGRSGEQGRGVRSRRRWRGQSSARICRGRTAGHALDPYFRNVTNRKGRSRQETCGADAADAASGRRPRDRDGQRHAIAIVTSCAPLVSNSSTGASSSSCPCATQPCSGSSAPATIRRFAAPSIAIRISRPDAGSVATNVVPVQHRLEIRRKCKKPRQVCSELRGLVEAVPNADRAGPCRWRPCARRPRRRGSGPNGRSPATPRSRPRSRSGPRRALRAHRGRGLRGRGCRCCGPGPDQELADRRELVRVVPAVDQPPAAVIVDDEGELVGVALARRQILGGLEQQVELPALRRAVDGLPVVLENHASVGDMRRIPDVDAPVFRDRARYGVPSRMANRRQGLPPASESARR